ncbi:MAG: hypothetical protein Q8P67_20460 [archaeon]|nr:hypothetical protein [archaeon]
MTAISESGDSFVWCTANHTLELISRGKHPTKDVTKGLIALATAPTTPHYFFLRKGDSTLFCQSILPLKTAVPKFEAKKPLSAFCFVPGDTIAALATIDGRVILVNYSSGSVLCAADEFSKIDKTSRVPLFLSFDKGNELLYVMSRDGMLGCWQAFQDSSSQWRLDRFSHLNFGNPIRNFTLSCRGPIHVLFEDGNLHSFVVHSSTSALSIHPTGIIKRQPLSSVSSIDPKKKFMILHPKSEYAMFLACCNFYPPPSSSCEDLATFIFIPFFSDFDQFSPLESEHGSLADAKELTIYRLFDPENPDRFLPVVSPQTLPASFFLQQKPLFTYTQGVFPYVNGGSLMGYDIAGRGLRELKDLPEVDIMYERPLCVRRILYSHRLEQMLVFYEVDIGDAQHPVYRYSYFSGNDESLKEGSDGCFLGLNHSHIILLTSNGRKIKVMPTSGDTGATQTPRSNSSIVHEFPSSKSVRRIFPSPQPYGVLYYISTAEHHGLYPSFSMLQGYKDQTMQTFVPHQGLSFEMDTSVFLPLEVSPQGVRESVIDVRWQSFSSEDNPLLDLAVVLTSRRIIVMNALFQVVTSLHSTTSAILPYLSCMWLDTCILYTTQTHLNYLSLDGTSHPIISLRASILCAILNDRILAAVTEGQTVRIVEQNVGLLEPLVFGLTTARRFLNLSESSFQELFQRALRRFDNVRITSHLLDNLLANNRQDVAFALIKHSSLQLPETKFFLALKSRQFETAFDILRQKYKSWRAVNACLTKSSQVVGSAHLLLSHRSGAEPPNLKTPSNAFSFVEVEDDILSSISPQVSDNFHGIPIGSPLYRKFGLLAKVCAEHGQFELARRCYVMMDDRLALLLLYVVHCSKLGVEAVNQVSKRDSQPNVISNCERLLKVRHLFSAPLGNTTSTSDDHSQEKSQEDSVDDEAVAQTSFTEYSQLGLKNWSFVTPATNWDTSQITSATMRVINRFQLNSFVDLEPIGFLDSVQKWLPKYRSSLLPGKAWSFGSAPRDDDHLSPGRTTPGGDRKTLTILPLPMLSLEPLPSVSGFLDISTSSRAIPVEVSGQPHIRHHKPALAEETIPDTRRIDLSLSDYDLVPLRLVSFLLETPQEFLPSDFSISFPQAAPASSSSSFTEQSPSPASSANPSSRNPLAPAIPPLPPIASPSSPMALAFRQESLNRDQRQPQDYVLLAWKKLEQRQYPGAVEDITHAIRLFVPPSVENNFLIKFCAVYKLALRILIEMKLLHQSSDKDRLLQLSVFLADLPILSAHRVEYLEKAIQMCLEVSRLETARRLFKLLQTMQPANIEKLRKQLMQSRSHTSPGADLEAVSLDSQSTNICYQSLQPLPPQAPHLKCQICATCFSEKEKKHGELCAVCMSGKLTNYSRVGFTLPG